MDYKNIITIEPGKRGGRPCIRGMRIAVSDVLGWLAAGMSHEEIVSDGAPGKLLVLDNFSQLRQHF